MLRFKCPLPSMDNSSIASANLSSMTFPRVPEVLETILHWVPTEDLLLCCRLVSKQWTKLSTPICRSRYVRLNFRFFKAKIGPDEEEVQVLDSRSFYSIFRSSDDLPWSYCTLRPWTRDSPHAPSYDLTRNEILQFVRAFGSHIRKIELGGDDSQIIMKIISSIPNVEEVNLTCDEEDMDAPVRVAVPVGRNFQLHRLKRICSVEIYGEAELNFLETLLNSAASPLDYVSLDLCGGEGVHEKKLYENSKIPLLLKGAVSISLRFSIKFRYAVRILSACAFNKLCISKLDVDFGGAGKRNEHTAVIGLFEDALQNLSTHLRKLRCRLSRPAESPALVRLPHLPVLKQLELEEYPSGRMYPGMSIHILHPFTTNQFPVLERIVIGPIFDPRRLFESACLDSVTQLTTKGTLHSMRSVEIDRAFPNLKTLHGCEVDGSDLEYIFTYITRLVHLGVEIDLKKEDHDLNVILSGISDPDHANYKWVPQQIEEYRAAHPRPSLLSMTCLRTLEIYLSYLSRSTLNIRDSGAHLSLLKIQPLDFLGLGSCQNISPDCVARLRRYHRRCHMQS